MCDLNNGFKLCTCKGEVDTDNSYWVFYRYIKGKQVLIIGEAAMPVFIDPEADMQNRALLLNALNEGNPFDVDLKPKENDRLALFFGVDEEKLGGTHLTYGFIYKRHKWLSKEYDPFEWEWKHDIETEGILI